MFNEGDQPLPLNPGLRLRELRDRPVQSPAARGVPSPSANSPARHTTRCSSTAASGSARRTCSRPSARKCWSETPIARILYLSCDSFINQFITAVENGDMNQFRYRYRHVDCWSSTTSTSSPAATARRKNSSTRSTRSIRATSRSSSRPTARRAKSPSWKSGWSAASTGAWSRGSKSRATRRASRSCRRRPACAGWTLPDDVVCYIAAKVENNTRELEGAITKLQGMSLLQDGPIDLDLAKAALGDIATAEQKRITIQQILDA